MEQISAGSELSINGSDSFDGFNIIFTGPGNVGGTKGDFSALAPCTGCVSMISSLNASSSGNLFVVSDNGLSASLILNPPQNFLIDQSGSIPELTAAGSGILTETGFDNTPGSFELTTQGPSMSTVTFSATATPTPAGTPAPTAGVSEPGSISLLVLAALATILVRGLKRSVG